MVTLSCYLREAIDHQLIPPKKSRENGKASAGCRNYNIKQVGGKIVSSLAVLWSLCSTSVVQTERTMNGNERQRNVRNERRLKDSITLVQFSDRIQKITAAKQKKLSSAVILDHFYRMTSWPSG